MISVIIPAHDGKEILDRAVQSVLRQNEDVEIIIIDNTPEPDVYRITLRYPFAKVYYNSIPHTPNRSRNIGIKNANGKYIAFLDQDDEWLPGKLKKQLEKIKNGADIVSSRSINRVEKK